jgi:hypothetical protein
MRASSIRPVHHWRASHQIIDDISLSYDLVDIIPPQFCKKEVMNFVVKGLIMLKMRLISDTSFS